MNKMIFTFGRFNPITIGHEKLINKMIQLRSESLSAFLKVRIRVYVSNSVDKNKNPLSLQEKIVLLKNAFESTYLKIYSDITTPYDALKYCCEAGYEDISFVIGSDRLNHFQSMKYYANEWGAKKFNIINAGNRDRNNFLSQASGTLMRQSVIDNNYKLYLKLVPKCFSKELTEQMWEMLNLKLNYKEIS